MAYATNRVLPEIYERLRADREAQNADSCLLRLPADLKLEIYKMCIDRSDRSRPACLKTEILLGPSTGLLQTCRFLRNDALPIFYGWNCFRAQTIDSSGDRIFWDGKTHVFVTQLPEAALTCIPTASFRLELCHNTNAILLLCRIEIELRRNGLPGLLTESREPGMILSPYDFVEIKARLQKLINKINQRIEGRRYTGVCKKEVLDVLETLKAVVFEDAHRLYTRVRSCDIILG